MFLALFDILKNLNVALFNVEIVARQQDPFFPKKIFIFKQCTTKMTISSRWCINWLVKTKIFTNTVVLNGPFLEEYVKTSGATFPDP